MFYYRLNDHLKEKFGCKVYKLSLDAGMSCPNRDGTVGDRGCIFCSTSGSGDFAEKYDGNINFQIENAKKQVVAKIDENTKYIAYFQSFTNTYGPIEKLEKVFCAAINHPNVVALSIATRPDCLPDSVLDLLDRLNRIKPIWVELGLQTIHQKTAQYIRRGYDLPVFDYAVKQLKKRGITIVAHMIIGLPYETDEMIYETAEYIGKSGVDGIKFHMLHVLKGTDLENEYSKGLFSLFDLNNYTRVLAECIRLIPQTVVVHRITGDGSKRELVAPLWTADKKRVLNYINRYFTEVDLVQGEHL